MKEHKMSRRSFLKVGAVASAAGLMTAAPVAANAAAPAASTAADEENCFGLFQKKPKYIFLFIGDGMGTAQIQSARFYQGTVTNNGAITEAELSFTQFPEVGSVTTYDSTSFCPDSASTATSIASGKKTESGVINMCPWTRDVPYETIAEKLHKQKGYKVGIVSTVNIDHATPAAFYAHQKTRKNYYQIGVELANSGFEYFAGGEFQIDNLVHIGHNCVLGENCLVVAQTGLAGSTIVGHNVTFAGQVGSKGHIKVGSNSVMAARTGLIADVPENSFYAGFPARPHQEWLRIKANESRLPDMMKKLKLMEKRLKALEEKNN